LLFTKSMASIYVRGFMVFSFYIFIREIYILKI
jgi:hypothetical protein